MDCLGGIFLKNGKKLGLPGSSAMPPDPGLAERGGDWFKVVLKGGLEDPGDSMVL